MRLSVQIEFDKTLDLETNKNKVIIGRSKNCDLVIPHEGISRQHCEIQFKDGHFFITDLGSSNGVSIDGQKIPPNQKKAFLQSQQLSIGNLDCEISEGMASGDHKVVSSTISTAGEYTATIRVARLDLNKPSKTLELEKTIRRKGPRNPVTAAPEEPEPVVGTNLINKLVVFILAAAALAAAWHFAT